MIVRNDYYREYYQKNKEKINIKRKNNYEKNKEQKREYYREYYQKNKEKIRINRKRFNEKNKEKIRIKRMDSEQRCKICNRRLITLRSRDSGYCVICSPPEIWGI